MEDSTLKQTSAIPLILLFQILLSSLPTSFSSDTLTSSESLSFNQTLISSDQTFELGFFSSGDKKFYLGIWFYNLPVQTIVWVANRDSPSKSSSINLKFGESGSIILSDNAGANPVWSSDNVSGDDSLVLQLLDTGNLVIREAHDTNPDNYIWQSFDHPTDTILSGQKLGWTKNPELDRFLTSWASPNDPSSGNYTFRMNRSGDPELFLLKSGIERIHRSGPWVGSRFSGIPEMKSTMALNFTFKDTPEDVYYSFFLLDPSLKFRVVLETGGFFSRYVWVPDRKTWNRFWFAPKNQCDNYLPCGPYGLCDANNLLVCGCPKGFTPKNPKAWGMRYSGDGCERKTQLECKTDGFLNLKGMKLPESGVDVVVDRKKTLTECKEMCRKDCNCTAYANTEVVAGVGSGCIMWRSDLLDLTTFGDVGGQDLFVRLASSDLETSKAKKALIIGVTVPIGAAILALAIAVCFICIRKRKSTKNTEQRAVRSVTTERSQEILLSGTITSVKRDTFVENGTDDLELPLFDFDALAMATENFSDDNKLGQGGFGCVYKGVLEDGQEVAVKRLSKESGQGGEEFKNEAKVIAKLQHRNLVRLLGCCVDRDEKMLVYEYLPNKSLHSVLFKKERSFLLDWERRFNIICGVARGLVYLHHDSRLRIIHRDLKASNVLLDHEMNPKISDFGMARIFGEDEMETSNTLRIVGTYGYMSPEYAMDGVFSIKSDVFSFGVLILEIVTGKKNKGFYNKDHELNLLGYAWKMWREGKGTELLDSSMGELYSAHEVLRCIQVGLLCVQERPEERPTMSTVVLLLSSNSASLPRPKLPGFCMGWRPDDADYPFSQQDETFTINQVTITMVDGR